MSYRNIFNEETLLQNIRRWLKFHIDKNNKCPICEVRFDEMSKDEDMRVHFYGKCKNNENVH